MRNLLRQLFLRAPKAFWGLILFVLCGQLSMAQLTGQMATYNLSSFTPQAVYKNVEKLYSANTKKDVINPDFGKVAPGVKPEWYEQYSKRTATSRSFIGEDGAIISGTAYSPINYLDKNGNYVAIHPVLSPAATGWSALYQEFPTYLNKDGSTEITLSGTDRLKFNFNNSIAGNALSITNFTVGDNGMMIHNAIAGVDKRIIFNENTIETDYLLNKPLTSFSGDLVISEEIVLPAEYSIKERNLDEVFGIGTNHFELVVINSKGEEWAHFKMPVFYDSNKDKSKHDQSFCLGKYILRSNDGRNFLDIIIPAAWLNESSRIYPVTIDPVVTGTKKTWSGGIFNSCFSPAFSIATMNVTVPANITITNFFVTGSYYADPNTGTLINQGSMYLSTPCGQTDTVTLPTDSSGTLYIIPYYDMIVEGACCLAPSCSQTTIALSEHISRTFGGSGCNALYVYYNPATGYPFQAYVVGHTVEMDNGPGSWTVSPTTLCSDICALTISATVDNGVPPYTMTHPWTSSSITFGAHTTNDSCYNTSTGTGSLTLNVPNCPVTCGSTFNLSVPAPTIVDACGNTVSGLSAKSVTQTPVPVVTPSPTSASICSGGTATILPTSCVPGSTITWTGSNGSSGLGNIVNSPVNTGSTPITVNYTLNVSANGCAGTPVIVPVTVNPVPAIGVNPSAPKICNGQPVSLTASGGSTYSWSPANGLSATSGTVVSANPSSTTIYTVTGTDGNGCTGVTQVTVSQGTGPSISVAPTSATVCGQPVSLIATGGTTYSWGPASGLSATTGDTVIANPSATTTYTVTGTDPSGCNSTATSTITIGSLFSVHAGPDTLVCYGSMIQLYASGGTDYTWTPSSDVSDTASSSPSLIALGTTTYTVTATTGGCSGTATVDITVHPPLPTPHIVQSATGDTLYCTTNVLYTSYQWYSDSVLIMNATRSFYVATKSGNYNVAVTDENGCSISVGINIIIGLPNLSFDYSVSLFPNPASDQLTIGATSIRANEAVTVSVIDVLGKVIQQEKIYWRKDVNVDIKTLASGIYFLQLQQAQGKWLGRFVKE